MNNSSESFYADLPIEADFDRVFEADLYREFPSDWHIIIADVRDSTRAIEAGRYKEVNLVGASCIIAALNACENLQIPFVFGGDGVTLVVPAASLHSISRAVVATQEMARQRFDLHLRVGVVAVSKAAEMGAPLLVAKFRVSENFNQAMFVGGGLAFAENQIKDPRQTDNFKIPPHDSVTADFSGLECRWRNIRSAAGETHSILIQATAESDKQNRDTYREAMDRIRDIYGSAEDHHPIPLHNMSLTLSARALSSEARLHRTHVWKLLARNLLGRFLFAKNSKTFGVDWKQYKTEVRVNTDFRKFDEVLRMVIGGHREQREQLEQFLQSQFEEGKLAYGIHHSTHALMTCLVFSRQGDHLHFIDGGDGGYALAARQLKQQLKVRGISTSEPKR